MNLHTGRKVTTKKAICYNLEVSQMTKFILALSAVIGIALTTFLFLIDPVTQQIRIDGARQRRYQQGIIFEFLIITLYILLIVAVVALIVSIVIGAVWFYRRNIDRGEVDKDRQVEVLVHEAYAHALGQQPSFAGVERVTFAPNLSTVDTYNPNFTQHHKAPRQIHNNRESQTIDIEQVEESQRPLPSFLETIERASGDNIVLGYEGKARYPVFGTIGGQYCMSVGGGTGSGKTTKALFLLSQSVANGAKIILVDPHAGNEESLATRLTPLNHSYYCPVATTEEEIRQSIQLIEAIFEGRKNGTLPTDEVIIFVCDEWLALMYTGVRDELARIAKILATQGRKYSMVAMFMSQEWTQEGSGGIRNTLAAHLVCNTRTDSARYQTGRNARQLPLDIPDLKKSEYYLFNSSGETHRLEAPNILDGDLQQLAIQLGHASSTEDTTVPYSFPKHFPTISRNKNPIGFSPGHIVKEEKVTEEVGRASQTQFTTEEKQIYLYLKEKKTAIEIAKILSNGKQGRAYKEAHEKVSAVMVKIIMLFGDVR